MVPGMNRAAFLGLRLWKSGLSVPPSTIARSLPFPGRAMPEILLRFSDNETTYERVNSLASELGLTPEQWVLRAIAKELGDYGLKPIPDGLQPKSLSQLFEASGVLKPRT